MMRDAGKADPDDMLSLQFVSKLKTYIDTTSAKRARQRTRPGTVKFRQDLREAEGAAGQRLMEQESLFQSCANHFATVRRQNRQRESLEADLPQGVVDIQLDFMQNMTWPLGPEEAQDWFWATAREQMTTLGFYCHFFAEGAEQRQYHHYISQILNHDSAFAIVCLK